MEKRENTESNLRKMARITKNILKSPFKRKVLIIVLAIILIIILCGAAYDSLVDAFSDEVSEFVTENPVEYDTEDNSIIISDDTIDGLIKVIEDMGLDLEDLELTREDVEKLYAAEVVSSEINRGVPEEEGKYYGRVYLKRLNPDTGELESLIFEPSLETFEQMDASQILNYFSIDGDKICIANTITTTDEEGNVTSSVSINKLSYKDNISQYTVPIEFLLDLCFISQNPGFVLALADKIINETEIVIQVLQNKTTIQTDTTYTYTTETETSTRNIEYDSEGNYVTTTIETDEPTTSGPNSTTTTQIQTNINSSIKVQSVKNWIMEVVYTYNKVNTTDVQTFEPEELEDEEKTAHQYTYSERETHDDDSYTDIYTSTVSRKINQTKTQEITITSEVYQNGVSEGVKDKVDEFIEMLKTPYSIPSSSIKEAPINNLENGAEMLFQMLRNGQRTQSLEQLMRYILGKATGNDYGVSEFDFSVFDIRDFITVGRNGGIEEIIKSYENEELRKYMNKESANYSSVQNYVTQDRTQYKMYYTSFDGCLNFSYGIMVRNKEGELNNEAYFAMEGLNLQELVNRYDSGQEVLVDVEILDRIFRQIVKDRKDNIKNILEEKGVSLKTNQLDALVNVAYQYGNCGQYLSGENNIAELYKTYYEKGDTETFKQKAVAQTGSGNLTHFFTGSEYSKRKEYNWILFNEGRYILSNGEEISASSSEVVAFAQQFIGENHSRFTSYNPTNGVSDIWFGADWCAMFVSYCYNECGLIPNVLQEPYAGCTTEVNKLKARGEFIEASTGYIPQPGDIVFFTKTNGETFYHTGIVESCDGTTVYTIEGNTGNSSTNPYWQGSKVAEFSYPITSTYLGGYFSINGN